jgi:hypothetical protein
MTTASRPAVVSVLLNAGWPVGFGTEATTTLRSTKRAHKELEKFTVLEILHGVAPLRGTGSRQTWRFVRDHLAQRDSRVLVTDLATFNAECPTAVDTAREIFSARVPPPTWGSSVVKGHLPGQLTKEMFDVLRFKTGSRGDYLRRQVGSSYAPRLTDVERELALMLAEEWTGTLSSLVDTARALAAGTHPTVD